MALETVIPYARRYAWRLVCGFSLLLVVDFLQLWIPRVLKDAVDALEQGTATEALLIRYAAIIVGLALAIAILRFFWRRLLFGFSRLLEMHLRNRMLGHVLGLDRAFFQRRTVGEVMALASNDLSSVQLAAGMGLVALVDGVMMTLAAIGFMTWISPTLTLLALLPMPILAVLTRIMAGRLHWRFKRVQERFSKMTEFSRSAISSIRLLKAYGQERSQSRRFEAMGEDYVRENVRMAVLHGTLFPVSWVVANGSLLMVLLFGGRLAVVERITVGDFVAFIAYVFMLTWPIMAMGWVVSISQRAVTSLARIRSLLDERPSFAESGGAPEAWEFAGPIRTSGLTFAYPGGNGGSVNRWVLRDVDVEIGAGVTGIVGRTGAGKSTLCHLFARLYPVRDNSLFYGDADANAVSRARIQSLISYVPQEVTIFSETIAANIALGQPEASQEEIERAARAASIHDEILAMENGYRTRVGERGVMLSGGQRQRVALARALLMDRPILLIDDGLSAVDLETEHAIIHSMAPIIRARGRICVIVSHRLAPLADADRIVVLERGRVAAVGTHSELLRTNDFYRTIYRHQSALEGMSPWTTDTDILKKTS